MPNKSGNAYGLTTLCPIKNGGPGSQSYAAITRDRLEDLPVDEDSPMAKVPNTYIGRFYVLDDVFYEGKPAKLDHLMSKYLVFVADFHGELEPYLKGMWNAAGDSVKSIWEHCVAFNKVRDANGFVDYIKKCQVYTTFLFNGSTDDSRAEQLKALYLKQEFSKFAFENQGKSPQELQQAFRKFVDRTRPTNLSGPTWRTSARAWNRRSSTTSPSKPWNPEMSTALDLYDIQGDVVKAYGRFGFPKGRYIFYRINKGDAGRNFINAMIPTITNGAPWENPAAIPPTSTNMSFTYEGLKQLGIPDLSLHSFPDEFSMGMKARRDILDDTGVSGPENWDPIWRSEKYEQPAHMLIVINGRNADAIEKRYQEICALMEKSQGGVEQLTGHRGEGRDDLPYQEGSVLYLNGQPITKEHFGYTDGISEPHFKGSGAKPEAVIGGGKPTRGDPSTLAGWEPLETGEFLLGHKDEAFEYPAAPMPSLLARNGTFMVYRKLHQNVGTFNAFLDRMGAIIPGGKEVLAAKIAGRWRNGKPLTTFPTESEANKYMSDYLAAQAKARQPGANAADRARYAQLRIKLVGFNYNDDLDGVRCPTGAHIRRVNPRGSLEFGHKKAFDTPGALDNRRRIIRRGLPYGEVKDPTRDDGNHGIIIMVLNASIKRQFEFVQQQWINYGNDFKLGNDKDPILGNQGPIENGGGEGRLVIQADPRGDKPPFLCGKIPTFVETRGGDYFFIPSMTALQLIGDGAIDPS